jgi:Heterokaryon incompatibility protein (HET)
VEYKVSNEKITGNRFNIIVIDQPRQSFPETIISLQACKNSIPSVRDSFKAARRLEVKNVDLTHLPNLSSLGLPTGRSMDRYINLQLLRDWISSCQDKHRKACNKPNWITKDEKQHPLLRLIDLRQHSIIDGLEECKYFALSYVWGNVADFTRLLKVDENSLQQSEGLLLSADVRLPKTIKDAEKLVYWLGYRYLWVDSLCIIQDEEEDKARQIQFMDSIYG